MKVLLAASEVAPIIKVGGLGDVLGSLPKALEQINVNADVIVPYFTYAHVDSFDSYKSVDLLVGYNGKTFEVGIYKTKLPNSHVDVYLAKNELFENPKISESEKFSFFSVCVVEFVRTQLNTYSVIHCHDWHTGMLAHLLEDAFGSDRPGVVFTIHNLMYQGITNTDTLRRVALESSDHPQIAWDILDGDLNFVQEGIMSADFITTVSENYAKEITTPEYGGELADILKVRENRLEGILNGLDYSMFPREFDSGNWQKAKAKYKTDFQQEFGLDLNRPLAAFVGRLDPNQKGVSLVHDNIKSFTKLGLDTFILGSGDKEWETRLTDTANNPEFKGRFACSLKFDLHLAERLYKSADFVIVPSKYEPCGLVQMIAMWYGGLPVVRRTGGLADTVKDEENGYVFNNYSSEALLTAMVRAVNNYTNPSIHDKLVNNALNSNFTWKNSAEKYAEIYRKIAKERNKS